MIKNDGQLRRTEQRLQQLQQEIASLKEQYSGLELEFWAGSLIGEAAKLRNEIAEYQTLRHLSFHEAVVGPLQEPVLLENISELLAKLRIAAKLNQQEMAAKLGWQQSNLSRFESENYDSQTLSKVIEYAGALGVGLYITPSLTERHER